MRLHLPFLICLISFTQQATAQSTNEQRHDAYFDDISTRRINTGQTDGPHRAGRNGFWTTQGKLQRGNESSGVFSNLCEHTVKYHFEERRAKDDLQYTLRPLRSIADLSNDPELANRARMTWNWGWMDIASFSFKGRWAIPAPAAATSCG